MAFNIVSAGEGAIRGRRRLDLCLRARPLTRVFNQDVYNLPKVQAGLETGAISTVTFANYQETKPRHFHQLLGDWIARP